MNKLASILVLLACACSSDDDASDSGPDDPLHDASFDHDAGDDASVDAASESDGGDVTVGVLPEMLLLEGTAEAEDGDDRVECRFTGMMTDLERAPGGVINGLFIGEIFRTTFTGGGQFEFAPLVGGPASITPIEDDQVELRFVGDQPEDALEFWLELEVVIGDDDGSFGYGGAWRCAPGLLGDPGFMDIDLTADGTWTLMPADG